MSSRLDRAANLVTITVGIAVTIALAAKLFTPSRTDFPQYKVGDKMNTGRLVDYSRANHTLLLVVDPTCGICTGSMPFYSRLVAAIQDSKTRLVVLGKDPRQVLEKYLKEHGIEGVETQQIALADVKVRGVPALFLADGAGQFRQMWMGGLQPGAQDSILASVKADWR
jgi:protein-disulfide isomerase-like protein with CxxC motif